MTIVSNLHQVKIGSQYVAKAPREEIMKTGKRFILTDNTGAGFQSPILALEAEKYFKAKGYKNVEVIHPEYGTKEADEEGF